MRARAGVGGWGWSRQLLKMAAEKALLWVARVQWLRIMGTKAELCQQTDEGAGFTAARGPCQMISRYASTQLVIGGTCMPEAIAVTL